MSIKLLKELIKETLIIDQTLKASLEFLKENSLTKVKYKKDQKVKVTICCAGCAKAAGTKKFHPKKGQEFSGNVITPNLNDRNVKFSGEDKETKVNFLLIDTESNGRQSFPQCCVDLGMKNDK